MISRRRCCEAKKNKNRYRGQFGDRHLAWLAWLWSHHKSLQLEIYAVLIFLQHADVLLSLPFLSCSAWGLICSYSSPLGQKSKNTCADLYMWAGGTRKHLVPHSKMNKGGKFLNCGAASVGVLQDNLCVSTGLIMWIGYRKEIRKLTFRALYQSNRSFNIPPPPGKPRAFDVFSCPGGR